MHRIVNVCLILLTLLFASCAVPGLVRYDRLKQTHTGRKLTVRCLVFQHF